MKLFLIFLWFACAAFGEKVEINADFVTANNNKGVTDFKGNVVITKNKDIMKADTVRVFMNEAKEIQKIFAFGNASFYVVTDKNQVFQGTSKNFTYYPDKKEIVLTGDAMVEDVLNARKLFGEEIVFDENTQLANVRGKEKEPVKVIFDIPDKKDGK
ncbi:MAG: lipopolysaccharide transport periplasmic protein LptA [Helicobacteraceae bacterium]